MASDFGEMADRVADLRDRHLPEEHEQATKAAMDDLQTEVTANIRREGSVARGVLVADVRHDEQEASGNVLTMRTVNVPEWAKYLEHGTGLRGRRDTQPNHDTFAAPSPMPPYQNILTWVVEKNITPTNDSIGGQYGLAAAIQQTIGEVGTFPHPFLRPAWFGTNGYQAIIDANRRAQRRALRRM